MRLRAIISEIAADAFGEDWQGWLFAKPCDVEKVLTVLEGAIAKG